MYPNVFFDTIPIETPRERIYRRLGYRRGVTGIPAGQQAEVEKYIYEAASLIRLRGAARRLPIGEKSGPQVALETGHEERVFKSLLLSRFLGDCREVVLMGATAGSEVMAAIEEDIAGDRVTRGVVFDAAASEMVDASLDWIMAYIGRELRRENKALGPNRFSAGYGDFLLENQGNIYRLLEMERIGVQITANFLLIPEKSVTALAGVKGMNIGCQS